MNAAILAPRDVRLLLAILNGETTSAAHLASTVKDDPAHGSTKGWGLSEAAAARLLALKQTLPEGRYTDLAQLKKAKGFDDDTYHDLLVSFRDLPLGEKSRLLLASVSNPDTLREHAPSLAAVMRLRLAAFLKPFLQPALQNRQIVAAEPVVRGVERLTEVLPADEAASLRTIAGAARALKSIDDATRVADVIWFPQVSALGPRAPRELLDPASLPGIGLQDAWFRSNAGVVLTPVGAPAEIELLEAGRWVHATTIKDSIIVEPVDRGIQVRGRQSGLLGGISTAAIAGPADAVRITCGGSLRGRLLGTPLPLDPAKQVRPAKPPCWTGPKTDVWINPIGPTLVPPTGRHPCHDPGRVVVAGGTLPPNPSPTDQPGDKPTVLIGTGPPVRIVKREDPWPPGWPWPWPGDDDDEDEDDDPKDEGVPVIYGEEIETDLGVRIDGCSCIRKPEVSTYTAVPTAAGGAYKWEIDDTDIAEIQGPDDTPSIDVLSKEIGNCVLTVKYTRGPHEATAQMALAVIYHRFTPRSNPQGEILAAPTFQPAPSVRIGHGSHSHELVEVQPERSRAKFRLSIEGELKDPLVDIIAVEVSAGTEYRSNLPRPPAAEKGFTDERFHDRAVDVYGPGRSFVRVRAQNSIGFWGTDTLEVNITIAEPWEIVIDTIVEDKVKAIERGATPSEIMAIERRLRDTWEAAMRNAEFEFGYLVHTDNTVRRIPGNEKWSVAVEDDEKTGRADILTSAESQNISLDEAAKKLLDPQEEPKNYFLLHEAYTKDRVDWSDDGRLLHRPGEAVNLVYLDPCCAHDIPGTGIEIESPGVQRIKRGEPVQLTARGLPAQHLGIPGKYLWECIAHPEGATFRFEPPGLTPARTVAFITDIPGVYSFKVNYELIGAQSPWTYAVADAQIVFEIDTVVSVHRLGDYDGELVAHRDRPYYRERTVDEQPGAEIMVRNNTGGPVGQDLDVTVLCPEELTLSTTLRAKAVFMDGTDKLFTLRIDPQFRFMARGDIRSARMIRTLHIIGIRYGGLPARRGDDVWVDVRVRALAPPILDLGGTAPAAAGAAPATGVFIADGDPIDVTPPDENETPNPRVNLLLRTRDLGNAAASHTVVELGQLGSHVNLANGNQYFMHPLFTTMGMGYCASAALHYNSKAATFASAVERYGELNVKTREQLAEEFGEVHMGRGWSLSCDMQIVEFVDVEGNDITRPVLIKCAELRWEDGNRIVFREVGNAVYHVGSEAETIGDTPNAALGMILRKLSQSWQLEGVDDTWWTFDNKGRLRDQSDARLRQAGRQLLPMRWDWSDTRVVMTDSAGRTTMIERGTNGVFAAIEAPNGARFVFAHQDDQLDALEMPLSIVWGFAYGEKSLLASVHPPLGASLSMIHYLGGAVEGVEEEIARQFWGRVARISTGDRRLSIRYDARPAAETDPQVVTCHDPEDHRWRYRYDVERQASRDLTYAPATAPDEYKGFERFEYDGETKLIHVAGDHRDAISTFEYAVSPRGKMRRLVSAIGPDDDLRTYRYDDRDRLETFTDEANATTSYEYENDGQFKRITYPRVPSLTTDLTDVLLDRSESFTYDELGRIETHTAEDGVTTTYGYGGAGDPHGTGNATSVTRAGRTDEMQYDVMGWLTETKDAFDAVTSVGRDVLGRTHTMTLGTLTTEYTYDALDRLERSADSSGRVNSTTFTQYSEPQAITNAKNLTRHFMERDRNGNAAKVQTEDGTVLQYLQFDPLGRCRRMHVPDVARSGQDGCATSNLPDVWIDYVDRMLPYAPTGGRTSRVMESAGLSTRTRHFNGRGLLVADELEHRGQRVARVFRYDPGGNCIATERFVNDVRSATVSEHRYDAAGQCYETTVGGVTTRTHRGRDGDGLYQIEMGPPQESQQGRRPSKCTRYDQHLRPERVIDGAGRTLIRYVYDDVLRTAEVHGADPSATAANAPLIHLLTITHDRYGQVVQRKDERTGITVDMIRDAAGRLEEVSSSFGTTTYTYDKLDNLETIRTRTPAVGDITSISGRDPQPPAVGMRDVVITHEYDAMGRLTYKGTGASAERWAYDALGRVMTIRRIGLGTGVESREEIYYDERGEHTRTWYGPQHYRSYEQDLRNRRMTETLHTPLGTRQRVVDFDRAGNLVAWSDANAQGVELRLQYDSARRMSGYEILRGGRSVAAISMDYGRSSRLNHFELRHAGGTRRTDYRYDANLNLTGAADSLISGGQNYEVEYNTAGLPIRVRRPTAIDASSTYTYHRHGGLARLEHRIGEDWEDRYIATTDAADYDRFGNSTAVRHAHRDADGDAAGNDAFLQFETHAFDEANRVTASTYQGTDERFINEDTEVSRRFFYDEKNRKRLELVRVTPDVADPDEQYFEIVKMLYGAGDAPVTELREWYDVDETEPKYLRTDYHYDSQGRRTEKIETLLHSSDPDDRWARLTEYRYGAGLQAERITVYELIGFGKVMISDTRFVYDPCDRLIHSTRSSYEETTFGTDEAAPHLAGPHATLFDFETAPLRTLAFSGSEQRFYVYAEGNLVAVLDGDGRPLQDFLTGGGVNNRFAVRTTVDDDPDSPRYEIYHCLSDRRGNLLALVEGDGEIKKAIRQSGTWGEFTEAKEIATAGGNWSDPSGLTQAGARKYDASIGQFVSPDPKGLTGGESRYVFAAGNPISFTDVNGKVPIPAFVLGAGLLGWFAYTELTSWGGAALTGDPKRERSASLALYHGLFGESVFGGPGHNHPTMQWTTLEERGWQTFIGATGLLGALFTGGTIAGVNVAIRGSLTTFGKLAAVDAGASIVGGAIETYRGNTLLGPLMMLGGATGLSWLQGSRIATRTRAPIDDFERTLLNDVVERAGNQGRAGLDPVVPPASRLLRNQHNELGPTACAISSFAMVLDAFGLNIGCHLGIMQRIGSVAGWAPRFGTFTMFLDHAFQLFLPNARVVHGITVGQLRRAVQNGHPVHLSIFRRGHAHGHSVVVDGVEVNRHGRIRFLMRDPDPNGGLPMFARYLEPCETFEEWLRTSVAITTHPQSWIRLW